MTQQAQDKTGHTGTPGSSAYGATPAEAARYRAAGWWGEDSLAAVVARNAQHKPDAPAFVTAGSPVLNWAQYARDSDRLAGALAGLDLPRGARIAILLPDSAAVHLAFLGAEKAGLIAVGLGLRAGEAEIAHLMKRTGARVLVTHPRIRDRTASALAADLVKRGVAIDALVLLPEGGRLDSHR